MCMIQTINTAIYKLDSLHFQADIGKARNLLGFAPTHTIELKLDAALAWYQANGFGRLKLMRKA